MLLSDLFYNTKVSLAGPPVAAVTNDTAKVSEICDTNGYTNGPVFVGVLGTNADANATYTVLVEDGNDASLTDNAAVADEFLCGVEAMGLNFDSDNAVFKIGYIGPKRYVRVTITPANNTGNFFFAGVWLQAGGRVQPKSTQVT